MSIVIGGFELEIGFVSVYVRIPHVVEAWIAPGETVIEKPRVSASI